MPFVRLAGLMLASALTLQSDADWRTIPVDHYPADAQTHIGAARDAALRRPDDADAVGQLALVLHAWEQFDRAATVYAEARRLAPNAVDWWVLSGTLASRMGRHEEAAVYFGKASTLAPSPILALRHADALLDAGRLTEARTAYDLAVTMPDAEPAARYGLGRIAVIGGDTATAQKQFNLAVELVPTFGAAHYAMARLHRQRGDLAAARASLARQQACLACWPMPPDPWATRVASVRTDARALMKVGLQSASAANDARAIQLHEEALAKDDSLLQAHVNLITLYARTGNIAKAEQHYRAVVTRGTQLAEAHHAFGLALAAVKEPARSEPILRLAVEANPQDAEALNALGLIQESGGRLGEAETSYRLATVANPRLRAFRFNLARVLVNLGRLDEALPQLAMLESPDDAESARYVYAAGAAHVRKGNVAEGRRLSEEALARARRHGLNDLAAAIERDLQKLK